MADKADQGKGGRPEDREAAQAARKARLAKALRDNLRRRKAQRTASRPDPENGPDRA